MFCVTWKPNRTQDSDIFDNSMDDETIDLEEITVLDIHKTKIIQTANDETTLDKHTSSTGVLENGNKYFVYRFVSFWDGFQVNENGSKSVDGIYLVPLNLPSKYRSSSSAIRVVRLVPKSVPSAIVLDEILRDINVGMVQGITDYDANGEEIIIFLDMVACIGDTPAINEMLDVRGHNAVACCHKCRFRRLGLQVDFVLGQDDDKLFKPRYMGTDVHGGKAFASRSLLRHAALEDFVLDDGTRKRLGIQTVQDLPFSRYQNEFKLIAEKIPLTNEGITVIPSSFHCYRGLLIGPDHLLFGLAKNCITAVLKLLPDESYIRKYERVAISMLRQARISTQMRLVDIEKKTLMTMSISEVFALLIISEYSFYACILQMERLPIKKDSSIVSEVCFNSIKLVSSLNAIGRLWFRPRLKEDGIESVKTFNKNHGQSYLQETQIVIEKHIREMRNVCTYDNDDLRQYKLFKQKGGRHAKEKKKKAEMRIQDAIKITKELDCPNVHRLLELAHVYLPMIGSTTRITDLEFERGHQSLKRVIERSNNRDVHVQAVSGAVYNDWQGRLSMLLRDHVGENVQRCLFRLLHGRDALFSRDGKLSQSDSNNLLEAIGPNNSVQKLLQMQGRAVMNDSVRRIGTSFWTANGAGEELTPRNFLTGQHPYNYDLHPTNPRAEEISKKHKLLINEGKYLLNAVHGSGEWGFANRVYPSHYDSKNKKPQVEMMNGDVMQCIGAPSNIFVPMVVPYSDPMSLNHAKSNYYYILFLFIKEGSCGAVMLRCERDLDSSCRDNQCDLQNNLTRLTIPNSIPHQIQSNVQDVKVMILSDSCQRVLVQHQCNMECKISEEGSGSTVKHIEHPLESYIYLLNREKGFPQELRSISVSLSSAKNLSHI